MAPLYRIREILAAWRHSGRGETLRLIYPFWDDAYKAGLDATGDGLEDLGRLSRPEMYELLAATRLVVSIPLSDSSPRSVYEAIFCGCCVAATYAPWIDALPACMRARLFIVDLEDADWLERALAFAADVVRRPYVPSEQAMEQFDQRRTLERACARFYGGGTLAAV
jgi:hypothetical protein